MYSSGKTDRQRKRALSSVQTKQKRRQKPEFSLMSAVYSLNFSACSLTFFAFAPAFAWCECALTFHGLELLCIHRDEAVNKNRYTYSYYPLATGLHLGILCSQMDGQTLKPVFLAQGKQRSCWQLYWKSKGIPEVMIVKVSAPFKSRQWSGSACYASGFRIILKRAGYGQIICENLFRNGNETSMWNNEEYYFKIT